MVTGYAIQGPDTGRVLATLSNLRRDRNEAYSLAASRAAEVEQLLGRVERLEREAQVLYEMLCKANELGQESNRVTRAQVERANALRKERFGI